MTIEIDKTPKRIIKNYEEFGFELDYDYKQIEHLEKYILQNYVWYEYEPDIFHIEINIPEFYDMLYIEKYLYSCKFCNCNMIWKTIIKNYIIDFEILDYYIDGRKIICVVNS